MGMFKGSDGVTDAEARIVQLERRLSILEKAARNYGIPVPTAYEGSPTAAVASPTVRDLAAQNRKIEAVKLLVAETGMGLKEAKDIVDQLV